MPPKRSGAKSVPAKGQSTLSFSNKITKNVPSHTKKNIVSSPGAESVKKEDSNVEEKPKAKNAVAEPVEEEAAHDDDSDDSAVELQQQKSPVKSERELQAEQLTSAQINKYWKQLESERKAPRVHQKDLTVSEKVLRYFDVSSQYGPCVGITRMRRWDRANKLGLEPPLEVLAVLLNEEQKGTPGIETAQLDDILNSSAVSA